MMMVMHVSYYDDESDHTVHCTQHVSPFRVTQNEFFVQKSEGGGGVGWGGVGWGGESILAMVTLPLPSWNNGTSTQ